MTFVLCCCPSLGATLVPQLLIFGPPFTSIVEHRSNLVIDKD